MGSQRVVSVTDMHHWWVWEFLMPAPIASIFDKEENQVVHALTLTAFSNSF